MIREAIILAGGLGTRLRSVVTDLPKCMAPVAGRPFIAHLIDYFKNQGIKKFIFSLGYKHEAILDYLRTEYSSLNFKYSIESEPLGTGGAIKLAAAGATSATVLVLNGDTLFNIELDRLSAFHRVSQADCSLSLKPMHHFDRYGVVELDKNNAVQNFLEKRPYASGLINGGVYALEIDRFLQLEFPSVFSFEKDYLEKYYTQGRIFGLIQDKYFIDIGIPEDYERAQTELASPTS